MKFPEKPLSRAGAEAAMAAIADGTLSEAEIRAFLLASRDREPSADELAGYADCFLRRAVRVEDVGPSSDAVIDVCGTGGDGSGTFNVSTTVALVLAGAGVRVAKHGNRSVSSRSGSFDVLEALGATFDLDAASAARSLGARGLALLFAPAFHPAFKALAPLRKSLGVPTVLNVLGPLLNPVSLTGQLIGVSRPGLLEPVAGVLKARGLRRAMVVHGEGASGAPGGLDELTLAGPTRVIRLHDGQLSEERLSPADFGLQEAPLEAIRGGEPAENARILKSILEGARGAPRDVVIMNAAAGLIVAGRADDYREAARLAAEAIDSGAALRFLGSLGAAPAVGAGARAAAANGSGDLAGDVLATIAASTRQALERRRGRLSADRLEGRARLEARPRGFRAALVREAEAGRPAVIAEIKFASPSQGRIREPSEEAAVAIAGEYLANGATAISVLTEEAHFQGSLGILAAVRRAHPEARLLLKDFVVDEYQVLEGRAAGADAVLVILALTGRELGARLIAEIRRLGMDALVEVHDEAELDLALELGATLVGVNSRNLKTLKVSEEALPRLAARARAAALSLGRDAVLVAESGITESSRLAPLAAAGYSAYLVGTALMRQPSPGEALRELLRPEVPRIKVCGITRPQDALLAAEMGAWALGFVFHGPSPRNVTPDQARAIVVGLHDAPVRKAGVFVDASTDRIVEIARHAGLDVVQLHGSETPAQCAELRARLPGALVVKAFRPGARPSSPAKEPAPPPYDAYSACDAVLIDSYVPGGALGGTGVTGDWADAARVARGRKLILAGGLTPDNVAEAVAQVRPYALDASSGLEHGPGVKSAWKLRRFFEQVGSR